MRALREAEDAAHAAEAEAEKRRLVLSSGM